MIGIDSKPFLSQFHKQLVALVPQIAGFAAVTPAESVYSRPFEQYKNVFTFTYDALRKD